ncbi:MAG: hypothetical protein HQ594_06965 [Candidatus Omnitrophica bacterium]|nr:hypothetical protein [Candidatus Omnitrophota bacterium]
MFCEPQKTSLLVLVLLLSLAVSGSLDAYGAAPPKDSQGFVGMPFGGGDEDADYDLCPHGVRVVQMFMASWQAKDYNTMYELIDDASKQDYSFMDAKFDFQFMPYEEYRISSIRKKGDNFEFILSSGSWTNGDKEIKKMLISGKNFKVIMSSRGKVFKESAEHYFR